MRHTRLVAEHSGRRSHDCDISTALLRLLAMSQISVLPVALHKTACVKHPATDSTGVEGKSSQNHQPQTLLNHRSLHPRSSNRQQSTKPPAAVPPVSSQHHQTPTSDAQSGEARSHCHPSLGSPAPHSALTRRSRRSRVTMATAAG